MDLLAGLNPEQRRAVEHGAGPLLILAGAGSGKTRVLTHRIAYLLEHGVKPEEILAITFTNKAAGEMRDRVEKLIGARIAGIWLGTFHAVCGRMLRREIPRLGYGANFVIYDSDDQVGLLRRCLREANLDEKVYNPRTVQFLISRAKNELIGPDGFYSYWLRAGEHDYSGFFLERVANVYRAYQSALKANNALDFDDLLRLTVEVLETWPDALAYWQERFRHILVDEYQDTNHAQYVLVRLLAARHQNLFVVGDDNQSIYGFRGADIRNILEFEHDFPQAEVIKLEENYRSTQTILDAANQLVANNVHKKEKRLWTANGRGERLRLYAAQDGEDEALFVVKEVKHLLERGYGLKDCAVLYRTNAQSRLLEEAFLHERVPYRIVGGLRFYERLEIKDILAYLRLLVNPEDTLSLERAISTPRRGIGPQTLARLLEFAGSEGLNPLEAAARGSAIPGINKKAAASLTDFGETMQKLSDLALHLPLSELVVQVLERTGYAAQLASERTPEAEGRLENLDEFLSLAKRFEETSEDASLPAFLATIALYTEQDNYDEGAEAVTLMTLHSAKGLEFPVVFLVGLEEGLFPHSRSLEREKDLEEERRLCYVGLTRAKRRLYLTYARERYLYGGATLTTPSRFIYEIPESLVWRVVRAGQEEDGPSSPASQPTQGAKRRPAPVGAAQADGADGFQPGAAAGPWRPGDRVQHKKFGAGTVVRCRGEGEDAIITVAFPNVGVKDLAVRYAPLKRL
ncbi:MAG: ATP-dependent helicase UvrD/PcrA [Bacillota bacterium]|jgi:DNA helicase-2/ATP-dependent DNA helicase PcrA|nr:ATP-dependent helicase UvrD/PcrA [Bacillota bacterium]